MGHDGITQGILAVDLSETCEKRIRSQLLYVSQIWNQAWKLTHNKMLPQVGISCQDGVARSRLTNTITSETFRIRSLLVTLYLFLSFTQLLKPVSNSQCDNKLLHAFTHTHALTLSHFHTQTHFSHTHWIRVMCTSKVLFLLYTRFLTLVKGLLLSCPPTLTFSERWREGEGRVHLVLCLVFFFCPKTRSTWPQTSRQVKWSSGPSGCYSSSHLL